MNTQTQPTTQPITYRVTMTGDHTVYDLHDLIWRLDGTCWHYQAAGVGYIQIPLDAASEMEAILEDHELVIAFQRNAPEHVNTLQDDLDALYSHPNRDIQLLTSYIETRCARSARKLRGLRNRVEHGDAISSVVFGLSTTGTYAYRDQDGVHPLSHLEQYA